MKLHTPVLLWVFGLFVAIGGAFGASALIEQSRTGEPTRGELTQIPQSTLALDQGVRLDGLEAVFSATETLVRVRLSIADAGVVEAKTQGHPVQGILPARDHFLTEGFAGSSLEVVRQRDGTLLLALPPILPGGAYSGEIPLVLTGVIATSTSGDILLEGTWRLALKGPAPDQLAAVMRMEALANAGARFGDTVVPIAAVRSTSETRLTMTLPSGAIVVRQPAILTAQGPLVPFRTDENDGIITAHYPATVFGSALSIDPGQIVVADGSESFAVTVNLGDALDRQGGRGGHHEFALGAQDVIAGDPRLVLSGERGEYGTREWVAVELKGNWPSEPRPNIYNAEGEAYQLAHVQSGFSKDASGTVSPGSTSVAAFVPDLARLKTLTFVMGEKARVLGSISPVTLGPGK